MPGVDDGHVGVDALVGPIDVGDIADLAADPRHTGRDRLGQLDDAVGHDRQHVRVGLEVALLLLVELGGEAMDGPREGSIDLEAVVLAATCHDAGGVRAGPEHDDEAAGGVGPAIGR